MYILYYIIRPEFEMRGSAVEDEVWRIRLIKGTVQRDFRPPFFSSFEPVWATDQWVKIFSISPSCSNFSGYHTAQSQSPRSILYCEESLVTPAISL